MIFKKLEMQGFKSFFDRTSVDFRSGINAVVGPNGCGKSNIADAIRWVLGEQSPKRLRGEQMEDLIFAGSDARGPLGMAEVTLTVESNGINFPTPYNEFTEVAVTRRLYRSGESEFFINRKGCRLRDIRELFLDTGMNPKAYAIIDQGHIGDIIGGRPENRRILFEEAAGIARFKERKATAIRKLDATEQNLLRLNDIIREVKRQIRSLKLQATKARKYNDLRDEVDELELKILYQQHCSRHDRIAAGEGSLKNLEDVRGALRQEIQTAEAGLETGRLSLLESEKEVSSAQEEFYAHRAHVDSVGHQLTAGRRRCGEIEASIHRTEEERTRLSALVTSISAERNGVDEELRGLRLRLSEHDEIHVATTADLNRLAQSVRSLGSALGEEKARFLEEVRSEGEARNRLTQAETMKESLSRDVERLESEIGGSREEERNLRVHESELKGTLTEKTSAREDLQKTVDECSMSLEENRGAFKSAEADLHLSREEHSQSSSKLASLTELELSVSGWPEHFRNELDRILQESRLSGRVNGLLAGFIDVKTEHEEALEAVLGERLKYLLVNNRETAMEAAQVLCRESEVRGTVLSIERRGENGPSPTCEGPGVIGRLVDSVTVSPDYQPVIDGLLQDVIVVEDLGTAERLWSQNGVSRTFVTVDGEVLRPDGSLTAGPLDTSREILPLLRRIRETKETAEKSAEKVRLLKQERERLEAVLLREEERLGELKRGRNSLDMEISSLDKDLSHTRQKIHAREERRRQLEEAHAKSVGEEKVQVEKISRELALKTKFEEERERREGKIASLEKELASLRLQEEEREKRANTIQVERAAGRERLSHLEAALKRFEQGRTEAEKNIEAQAAAFQELAREKESEQERLVDLEGKSAVLAGSQTDREKRLADLQEHHRQAAGLVLETEENLRLMRLKYDELQEESGSLKAKQAELQARIEHTREKIVEMGRCAPEELWDEETRETVRGEDPAAIEELHGEKSGRLQSMGLVNQAAIGDHEELQERLDFQRTQREDLEKAVEDLRQAILKINMTSRKKFVETFEKINEKFQIIFPLLFLKGQATLRLTDSQDPLEAGIEVYAQPAGKKLQRLSLLSGGEKALSAIALLLSIFMVKPTPFCLLDEVDAPLDESNTVRFLDLLKTSINGSQLVVITHNKQTMQRAENLVGVTMANPGISSLISVQLESALNS